LGEIIKIVPTRGHVLRLKCTKYYFGWGSAPDPAEGDYSACQNHWKGAGLLLRRWEGRKGKGGESIEEGRRGKGREGKERNVAFHHLLLSNLTTAGFNCMISVVH